MSEEVRPPEDTGSAASHCYAAALEQSLHRIKAGSAFHRDYLLSELYYEDQYRVVQEAEKARDLQIKYNGRLCELRQCEEDRNEAWKDRDKLREVVNRMERALLQIVMGQNELEGPSLDYMQGYRDGQEHQARIARKALGHGQ